MADDDVITFARASEQRPGMIPGDVKMRLKVQADEQFTRHGRDLHTELRISLREALLGFRKVRALAPFPHAKERVTRTAHRRPPPAL
jgi:DnaJ-class molecular chaperone